MPPFPLNQKSRCYYCMTKKDEDNKYIRYSYLFLALAAAYSNFGPKSIHIPLNFSDSTTFFRYE